jgi:hypothetical protein
VISKVIDYLAAHPRIVRRRVNGRAEAIRRARAYVERDA